MKELIAKELLEIKAVTLSPDEPYTWSSGLKSPIYCDNRLTLSFPDVRGKIADGLTQLVKESFPEAEMIAGTATAGIPHAALVAERLNLPMCYVRSSAKAHGKGKQIEGQVHAGMKVVVIEDLISTGGSSITAVKALREAGCDVVGVAAIFTYELEKGNAQLADAELNVQTLTNYSTLIDVAVKEGYVTEEHQARLQEWKKDPENWFEA
ncbi:orotate phosphoribosyltransferase [Fictibacillus sp. Mic-4]|uniref:orotate phosphoribosyltransferase n=1 Tax=Fictibacillus sp. Mic-4 TaxID=3132826 RepID=UPI003CFB522B